MLLPRCYLLLVSATALGSCKSFSALGAIASPWVGLFLPEHVLDGHIYAPIVFGIFSCISGLLAFFLADTVGFPLPNTFEDVQRIKILQKPIFKVATVKWNATVSNSDIGEEGGQEDAA